MSVMTAMNRPTSPRENTLSVLSEIATARTTASAEYTNARMYLLKRSGLNMLCVVWLCCKSRVARCQPLAIVLWSFSCRHSPTGAWSLRSRVALLANRNQPPCRRLCGIGVIARRKAGSAFATEQCGFGKKRFTDDGGSTANDLVD